MGAGSCYDLANKTKKKTSKMIKNQLQQWVAVLPNYIKAYLPISCCESWVII
jgi:hypothetical protein